MDVLNGDVRDGGPSGTCVTSEVKLLRFSHTVPIGYRLHGARLHVAERDTVGGLHGVSGRHHGPGT
jgi:hypothetical protein